MKMKISHSLWLAALCLIGCTAATGEDAVTYVSIVNDGPGGSGCMNPEAAKSTHSSRTIKVTITDRWSAPDGKHGVNNREVTLGPSEQKRYGCRVEGSGGTIPAVNHQFNIARADFLN
jgi:hypothetical protein